MASGSLTRPDPSAVARAARLLAGAERPVLVAGSEIARRHAADPVVELAERLRAPVFEEGRRDFLASAVPTGHPAHAGLYDPAHPAVRDADVLAFLGCRLFTEFEAGISADLPPSARIVHLHPDTAELGRLHPVDAPVAGDPALAMADLLDQLPACHVRSRAAAVPVAAVPGPGPADRFPGHVGLEPVVAALATAVDRRAPTVVLDATTATVPLLRGLRTRRSGQLLSSTSGSLGWGMGAALGVRLAEPGNRVMAVLGDGAFQFGLPALWTAGRYRVPVVFVVLDNGTYAAVASALSRFGGAAVQHDRWPGTDIGGLDIPAVAEAFGVPAMRVAGADGLTDALMAALDRSEPSVVHVRTGPAGPAAAAPSRGGRAW
jgi:benzoylformate decarboxylase